MRARRRISPASTSPIRATRRWWCRPNCRRPICARTRWSAPATSWRWPIRRRRPGQQPAGLELFDVSVPEKPRSISFFDCSGATSRGVHQLWFCDGEYVHMASGAPDFKPSNPLDDQFYRCIDVRDPSKPKEIGRWWMPGTLGDRQRRAAAAPSARQGLPRAQHQRLSVSGRTGCTSATSTAACS